MHFFALMLMVVLPLTSQGQTLERHSDPQEQQTFTDSLSVEPDTSWHVSSSVHHTDLRTALLFAHDTPELMPRKLFSDRKDSTNIWKNPKFRKTALITLGADVGILAMLWQLWYADYPLTSFHWHNDFGNWAHMDKLGHFLTSKTIATFIGSYLVEDLHLPRRKAGLVAALAGGMGNSQLELLDGISEEWGASPWDLAFNFAGGAIGGIKIAEPNKTQWFDFKISYHPSPQYDKSISKYFALRYAGNFLKDYEGETQWMVIRPQFLVKSGPISKIPRWLGVAIGYGADNIPKALKTKPDEHVPEWYIALDFDIRHLIPWKKNFSRRFADIAFTYKLPAPTIRLSPNPRFYWLYK